MPELVPPRYLTQTVLEAKDGMEVCATNNVVVYRGVGEQMGASHSERVDKALQRLCKRYDAKTVELSAKVLPPQFIRFLCKIAYGFYVSERGMFPLKDSPALAILKADRTDYSNWVGSRPTSAEGHASSLHRMSIEDIASGPGAGCEVVNISLFNKFGQTFQYTIVVRAPGWTERIEGT